MINQANKLIHAVRNYLKSKGVSDIYIIILLFQINDKYYLSSQFTEDVYTNKNHKSKNSLKSNNYIGNRDSNGYKDGFGIEQINTGSKYVGLFSQNKKNGWGKLYKSNSNEIFKCYFIDDKMNGFGEYTKGKDVIYYGIWNNDKQNGIGYELWVDSSNYFGEYNNGKKEGIGTYLWSDKSKYEGEWKDNNIDGFGIYYFPDGRHYLGEWKNQKMNGYGEFYWTDGKKYCGFYKEDQRDGFGLYYLLNDSFYVGFWKDGLRNGLGKYIKGKSIKYGIWKKGKKEKWFNNEEDFNDNLESESDNEKYKNIFKWSIKKIKKNIGIE